VKSIKQNPKFFVTSFQNIDLIEKKAASGGGLKFIREDQKMDLVRGEEEARPSRSEDRLRLGDDEPRHLCS